MYSIYAEIAIFLNQIRYNMKKNKGWRNPIVTPEAIQKLEEAFSWWCSDLEACLHANIWKSTLYNYQNDNPEFLERKEILKEKTIILARQTVVKSLKDSPDMALKYLERKRKAEFSTRTESTWAVWWSMELKVIKIWQDNIL